MQLGEGKKSQSIGCTAHGILNDVSSGCSKEKERDHRALGVLHMAS